MDKDVALEPYENAQEKSIVNWLQEEFGDKYVSTSFKNCSSSHKACKNET
jgi:hypothetical protein